MKKVYNVWHMVASFAGGVVITALVLVTMSGNSTLYKGQLGGFNPGSSSTVPGAGSGANGYKPNVCNVTNCDISAKLDQVLAQLKVQNYNGTFGQYVAEMRNDVDAIAVQAQFTDVHTKLNTIMSHVVSMDAYIPALFTDVNNKLDVITGHVEQVALNLPGFFTDVNNKLDKILSKL